MARARSDEHCPASGHLTGIDFLVRESEAEYRRRAETHLTSHALADFRKCPLLYWKKKQGLIPDEDRPAYLVGRAAHKLILEGIEAFEGAYAVGGPINPNSGRPYGPRTKAYAEWAGRWPRSSARRPPTSAPGPSRSFARGG